MKMNGRITVAIIAFALFSTTLAALADGVARSQFRRTVDPSERSGAGTLLLRNVHGREVAEVNITGLNLISLGTALGTTNSFGTNNFIYLIAPISRTGIRKGVWSRRFGPSLNAPDQFSFFVDRLDDLSGLRIDIVAAPATTNIVGDMTNFVGGVTNIIGNTTNIVGGTTEVVAGMTNLFFDAFLWAPIPPLLPHPAVLNFSAHGSLQLPDSPEPSPRAAGNFRVRRKNTNGRSILDIRADHLVLGQAYSVWFSTDTANTNFLNAGTMELNRKGGMARYLRDTKFGDPLPQQVADVSDLRGRVFLIKDAFDNVHLFGVIP